MGPQSNSIAGGGPAPVLGRALRANPAFELVLFDRLPEAELRPLEALARDPELYGVLRSDPRSGLGIKTVDRETALLFLTLARPGPLPAYVRARLGEDAATRVVERLVADGVLEVEAAAEPGRFVSGAAALLPPGGRAAAGGRLAELSRDALRYGEDLARELASVDPLHLSMRLYTFNRWPLTPAWRRQVPDAAAVRSFVGASGAGPARRRLARGWVEEPAAPGDVWLRWRPLPPSPPLLAGGAIFKLYISPLPGALPDVFAGVLDGLAAAGAPRFKLGAGAGGMLRADKMVAYYGTFEQLAAAAAALAERLAGVAAQGVPFSSEIGAGGLLSWGVDPPAGRDGDRSWRAGASWRSWLTHRLARALIAALAETSAPVVGRAGRRRRRGTAAGAAVEAAAAEPWRWAVERLRLEGVDTDSWTPGGRFWPGDGGLAWR